MSIFTLKKTGAMKFVSVFAGTAMALTLVFGGAVAPAQAQTVEELTAQISSLLAMITSLQAQLSAMSGGTTSTGVSYNFTKNLSLGASGADVLNLQKVLNMSADTQVAAAGVGSAGLETEYFGGLTKAAVIKFQNKYTSEILTPVGLTAGTGFVGASTRAKLNTMTSATTPVTPVDPTTPVVVPTGTGLTVSAGSQPAATLAPEKAARVPFTKVVLTASADGDVVVNSILIERTGLAQDAAFAGVVLLDEDGTQIGIAKTLNSLHQATVGENFTVKAGTSKTVTIAGNMNTSTMSSYTGQVGSLTVVGVNTSAAVTGALPIVGTSHTMNSSLTIGTVTPARGVNDPNSSATKEVGVTGYTFSSVKVTAGSAEKVRIHSIRWNQSGSVSASDLANLKTYVDGTAYDVKVSADGKYFTSSFGSGLVVDKGLSKEISIKGDIESGSGRTIAFDLYKNTDLYVTGETFGYGISPSGESTASASDSSSQFTTGTPWYDNAVVTVSSGSLSASKSTTVEAQNIAENVANQVLGGFDIEAKGEAVSVASMVFDIDISGSGGTAEDITNVSLVDANGSVVAGPVDGVIVSTPDGKVTFTDTVTFPVGKATYTLKGQLNTDFTNDQTVIVNTNPSSDWTTVTGQTTGNSITPSPAGDVTSNTMTLKAGSAVIYTSASPVAQNIVAGAQGFVFANFQFDATASGEDVKFTSLVINMTGATNPSYLTGCQLFDGTTALNTGSNVKDVTATGNQTFTLDSGGLVVAKGTLKTLALKCNLSASATSETYLWNIADSQTGTGLDSGSTITATASGSGQTMTATTGGSFTVAKDDSSPAYKIVAAGTTDVVLAQLKFTGLNEAINLKKVGLELTDASSTPSDLTLVTLWDGTTKVGTVTFNSNYATSTLTTDFVIPKDGSKVMTVKGDIAQIGTSKVGTQGALLKVNYDGSVASGTQGVGAQSGTTISTGSASDTAVDGVRVFRAYPTFAKINVDSTTLISTTDATLYKFSVTANGVSGANDGIGLSRLAVNVATSTASSVSGTTTVTNLEVFAYTDSGMSSPVSGFTNGSLATATANLVSGDNEITFSSLLNIPAGATYYFKVVGDTTLTAGSGTFSGNVTTKISGDAAYPSIASAMMLVESGVAGDANGDFIWSPHATTTSAAAHVDWTNGYMVDGLPSSGSAATTISK